MSFGELPVEDMSVWGTVFQGTIRRETVRHKIVMENAVLFQSRQENIDKETLKVIYHAIL